MRGRLFLWLMILCCFTLSAPPVQAAAGSGSARPDAQACVPGSGWRWTPGPDDPQAAAAAVQELAQKGILAEISAAGYGETDSCGTYFPHGVDFHVRFKKNAANQAAGDHALGLSLLPALQHASGNKLGNVYTTFPDGGLKNLGGAERAEFLDVPGSGAAAPNLVNSGGALVAGSFYRKVYVIILNPTLSNGQKLIDYMHWTDPNTLIQGTIDFFNSASHGQLQYQVAATTVNNSGWPVKQDGFVYTASTYLAALSDSTKAHQPDLVNYNSLVNNSTYDICGRANRGEIDEVWVYGGPWFGFYESTLVGPGAYWYNSSPVPGPWSCTRLVPIMAPSYERQVSESVENFGHRSESTMTRTYGSWDENSTAHNWDRFGLVKAQSPNFSYSGCGSVHFPPNGARDYDWANPASVPTYCDDFALYPNLPGPPNLANVTCSTWGCSGLSYFQYWFGHFPHNPGCGPDSVSNLWWYYLAQPALANTPLSACTLTPALSLNQVTGKPGSTFSVRGTGYAAGSAQTVKVNGYTFGSTVTPDAFGNFIFLLATDSLAKTGPYTVTIGSASTAFTLDASASLLAAEGSGTVFALPASVGIPFAAPSNLTAIAASKTQINLAWKDNSSNESSFIVERSANGSTGWSTIATLRANTVSYSSVKLTCSTAYFFRVRAFRSSDGLYSAYSNVASATTKGCR